MKETKGMLAKVETNAGWLLMTYAYTEGGVAVVDRIHQENSADPDIKNLPLESVEDDRSWDEDCRGIPVETFLCDPSDCNSSRIVEEIEWPMAWYPEEDDPYAIWYAVVQDGDSDAGYGSHDYSVAVRKAKNCNRLYGRGSHYIAVFHVWSDIRSECIYDIRAEDF